MSSVKANKTEIFLANRTSHIKHWTQWTSPGTIYKTPITLKRYQKKEVIFMNRVKLFLKGRFVGFVGKNFHRREEILEKERNVNLFWDELKISRLY